MAREREQRLMLSPDGLSAVAEACSAVDTDSMTRDSGSATFILDGHECWELLRSSEVGRLAVAIAEQPDIFPVNYVIEQGTVVFRTAEGTKLNAAIGSLVAFEVDGEDAGDAWSVVVKGRAEEITQMYEVFDAADLPLYPWNAAPKHRFVRIVPDQVSGRRFRIDDRAAEHSADVPVHRATLE